MAEYVIDGVVYKTSKVASIEAVGTSPVFDIEVKGVHNYYANGINVHNCSYHSMLDDTGERLGTELYAFKDTFINYKHRKLLSFPSGPNKRTLRGRTTVKAAIDELGWFKNDDGAEEQEKQSAKEVYIALDRTLKTVRTAARKAWKRGYFNVPMAYGFYLSSPSSAFDMIMQLVKSNVNSKTTLAVQLPTWEINPNYKKSDFAKEYKADPVKAERDYGANPPLGDNQYIENQQVVVPSFKDKKNRVSYRYITSTPKEGKTRIAAALTNTNPLNPTPRSLMSIDAGEVNNSFVCTVGHYVDGVGGVTRTVTDAIIEVIPEYGEHKVSFNQVVRKTIIPLLKTFNIGAVVADRWQSTLILDTLREEHDVHTQVYSLKRSDFDLVKSYLEGGMISNPALEWSVEKVLDPNKDNYPKCFDFAPVSHLLFQMMTVTDTGRTVSKGVGLTDDIFRSWALLHKMLLDEKFREEYLKAPAVQQKGSYGVIAIPGGQSGNIRSNVIVSSSSGISASSGSRVFSSSR